MPTFDQKLDNLAAVALRVGVNLQHDGRLLLVGPIAAADLMRRITAQAYDLGASYVHAQYVDERLGLIRAQRAREETLDRFPQEHADMIHTMAARGDAYLRIDGSDPDLMSAADPARVATMVQAARKAMRSVSDLVQRSFMPWTIVPFAAPAWARKVFPDLSEDDAQERLWDAIFAATRADRADPVAAWAEHVRRLDALGRRLSDHAFRALHLRGPGTDLRVGLAEGHRWESGGRASAVNGLPAVHNVPTEEVFTAPHARRVDGTVRASKPLSYQGQLIDGFSLTFEDGLVVDHSAERGEQVLRGLLDTDEGARRLGEVALVPHSSPIGQSGLLFYDTLFDENAASHLALGRAYPTSVRDGASRSPDEAAAAGVNGSLVHVDFMVGSAEMDVDGLQADGTVVGVMRAGAWTIV
jgi:aminopeptidase